MSAPLVLAVSDGGSFRLTAFEGVPILQPGLIVIAASGSTDTEKQAARLASELRTVLLGSAAESRATELTERPADPSAIMVFAEKHRRTMLALVCDGTPVASRQWFVDWTGDDAVDRRVMPIFEDGVHPDRWLPPELRVFNVEFWSQGITEAVPAMLASAGITLDDQRVFISYRRLETQPLAQQLFDRLTQAGFDVFLDRFSIESGVNFQQRLMQELSDKSMVLLLESANIDGSTWTQDEIAFIRRYGLGLLALQLPDRASGLDSIDPDERRVLDRKSFVSGPTPVANPKPAAARAPGEPVTFDQWPELKDDELRNVVALTKRIHDQATFRRRNEVRQNAIAVLRTFAGVVPASVGSDGILPVKVTDAKGGTHSFGVWLTTRPPDFGDFHSTSIRGGQPPVWKGVICGPADVLERNRRDKLQWISGLCGYGCFDLAELAAVAERMQKGTL